MNNASLSTGQVFSNYKVLCLYIGEPVLTGLAKESQLSRWKLLFSWQRSGHKYIIEEVFSKEVQAQALEAKVEQNLCLIKDTKNSSLMTLLLAVLSEEIQRTGDIGNCFLTDKALWQLVSLRVEQLEEALEHEKLSELFAEKSLEAFKEVCFVAFKEMLDSVLDSLQRRNLLIVQKVWFLKKNRGAELRLASLDEETLVGIAFAEAFLQLSLETLYAVYAVGKQETFWNLVHARLKPFGIIYFQRMWKLSASELLFKHFVLFLKNQKEVEALKQQVMQRSVKKIEQKMAAAQKKAKLGDVWWGFLAEDAKLLLKFVFEDGELRVEELEREIKLLRAARPSLQSMRKERTKKEAKFCEKEAEKA